jgi:hypothetical protein
MVPDTGRMRHVSDDQRRARLAVRHALAPQAQVPTPEAATRAMTVLHATEPATVYLSCWARVPGVRVADVDRALSGDRSLVKQLAMRRTIFVFPRDLLPAVLPSAAARVAGAGRARMAKDLVAAGVTDDGGAWLDRARAAVLAALEVAPDGLTALELRTTVAAIDVRVAPPSGEPWGASRVLVLLGAAGDIVRGTNTGHWRTSRPKLTLTRHWLGGDPVRLDPAAGYRELVRRWLYSFGPGTEADLVWWLGSTKAVVRTALAEVGAVAVSLDGGDTGWLLPDDLDDVPDPGPWVALLPVLDPTTMGWQARDFYLGPHGDRLFERRGNAGTTAWVDGRAVGCWVHDPDGTVRVHLLEAVSPDRERALRDEAERLTAWLSGQRVATGYVSPAMKDAVAVDAEADRPGTAH